MEQLVEDFLREVYFKFCIGAASDSTKGQYRSNLKKLRRFLGRPPRLSDLTPDNAMGVAMWMVGQGRSPATANKVISQYRALLNEAVRRGLAKHAVFRKLPEYKRAPTAWSQDQLRRLFESCYRMPGFIHGIEARLWWVAIHCCVWDSGLRIGAILKAEWHQFDLDRGVMLALAEHQKQNEDQQFRLHPDTVFALSLIRDPKRRLVFPWERDRSMIWQHYEKILERAGLPVSRRNKFHKMRRTVASWFEAFGGNATELLGHSSRKITKAYLDDTITGKPHASDLLFRPMGRLKNMDLQLRLF